MNKIFDELKKLFKINGYHLYMIGGTSRDYLLKREISDYDFVTDATPEDILKFLKVDMTFARFGTVKYYLEEEKIDITTMRVESDYLDKRHPQSVHFVKDIEEDYKRRDFTINAIYIDEDYKIIDPTKLGVDDLMNKRLRFIGNPLERIKEDPLRILRGERFAYEYGLKMDLETEKAFEENKGLLRTINQDKIIEENRKLAKVKKA